MIGGGAMFWGSLLLETSMLGPDSIREMLELEEAEDRRQAAFYGLSAKMLDPDVPDSEYFGEVRLMLLLRCRLRRRRLLSQRTAVTIAGRLCR